MNAFRVTIYIIAAIPLITGLMDLFHGVAAQQTAGMTLSEKSINDPLLNSTFRFFAGLWFGVGLLLILFVRDLKRYSTALSVLFLILFVGGIGRLITMAQLGLPEDSASRIIVLVGIGVEIVLMPILYLWQRKLAKE